MRWRHLSHLLVVSSALFVVGCGSSNKGKIEGTKWVNMAGLGNVEFGADGSLSYMVRAKTYKGTYELGSGRKVTFNLTENMQGTDSKVYVVQVSIDEEDDLDAQGEPSGYKRTVLNMVHPDGGQAKYAQVKTK